MIPGDLVSRPQQAADIALRPVAPTQELTDKLGGLDVGQRIRAEIQAMLPNGTYRALVNQRNITLALPFSAKSGDTLELLVTESDGKTALAVLSHQSKDGTGTQAARESVSTTLSRAAQTIAQLSERPDGSRDGAKGLALNNNQPIAETPPRTASDILPQLKQAIAQSGMFYESHQADWVEGRLAQATLLQEPQGKLSAAETLRQAASAANAGTAQTRMEAPQTSPGTLRDATAPTTQNTTQSTAQNAGQVVAPQAQPIVQHQLDALATQNFVWQGQAWPGQAMRWEIEEDGRSAGHTDDDTAPRWRTGLRLTLPMLGGVSAQIGLDGKQLSIDIRVDEAITETRMRADSAALRQQLDQAGLTLSALHIVQGESLGGQESQP